MEPNLRHGVVSPALGTTESHAAVAASTPRALRFSPAPTRRDERGRTMAAVPVTAGTDRCVKPCMGPRAAGPSAPPSCAPSVSSTGETGGER